MGRRAPVSFEIDCFDRAHHTGWSVVVSGYLDEVTPYDAETFDRVHKLAVDPWAGGENSHWVRIVPSRITGREVSGCSAERGRHQVGADPDGDRLQSGAGAELKQDPRERKSTRLKSSH